MFSLASSSHKALLWTLPICRLDWMQCSPEFSSNHVYRPFITLDRMVDLINDKIELLRLLLVQGPPVRGLFARRNQIYLQILGILPRLLVYLATPS